MIQISNDHVMICCEPDGTRFTIRDKKRGMAWRLDGRTRTYRLDPKAEPEYLGTGRVTVLGPEAIREDYDVDGRRLSFLWELLEDGVAVTLEADEARGGFQSVALPGSFLPERGPLRLALPMMQGLLYDGRGEAFEGTLGYGGHFALSMAMLGYLTDGAGLLLSVETATDWSGTVGKREDGTVYAYANQTASLGGIRYARTAHLYLADGDLTAVCRRYRRRVQARGGWKPWEEKIAERPAVERLFGALMAFVGYNQDTCDYVDGCRKLRQMGFDRAFLYPVRFNTYATDFQMGGDPPVHLSDGEIRAIKDMGYDVAPWAWVVEALDDGSERINRGYLRDASGDKVPHWQIDDYRWYLCCTPFQTAFVKQAYAGAMREMTWTHFDVNVTAGPRECYAEDHPWHEGRVLDRRGDLVFLRDLLGQETNGDRIVSSEGFRDILADVHDIGTTKLLPAFGEAAFWTVPMTMLVYHDSIIHDWWEVHNYNAGGGFDHKARWGHKCDGFAREKAALDALYGCPPNVFPFGRQYRWVDLAARKTESFSIRFEDPAVQEALALARPVTQLHRRIGMLDMCGHEFLSEDGAAQVATFSDGTRVAANLGDEDMEVEGIGQMAGKSWKRVE